jgi:nucleoside-diphosphate-sugar epimerase
MNIILTGSNGFLGKIIRITLKSKYKISGLSRNTGEYKVLLDREVPVFSEVFDLIIHCAGKAHFVAKNEAEIKQFHDINVIGTKNLLKGLEKVGVPKQFVFISSVSVYGLESGSDIDEEESLSAKDPFGLSKIEAEMLITNWCKEYNVVCTILRLPLLVGVHPPGNLGVMIKAIQKGYYFNVGGGKAKKSMVLAEDVARFIPKIAPVGGTYNLTDGLHPSFSDLSHAIANKKLNNLPLFIAKIMGYLGDLLGEKAPINSIKIKKITSNLTFDDSKARNFGWKSQSVLEYLKNNNL